MKIGILGNMNNNGFALLRYLRDLGEDAYLLLFRDDETGFSSHFSIKSDTWEYDKWKPFIKDLSAVNSYSQAISSNPFNRFILFLAYLVRKLINSPSAILTRPPKNSDIDTINKKVCKSVNADFVGYNTVENLSAGIGKKSSELCMACHDGEYGVLNRNLSNETSE